MCRQCCVCFVLVQSSGLIIESRVGVPSIEWKMKLIYTQEGYAIVRNREIYDSLSFSFALKLLFKCAPVQGEWIFKFECYTTEFTALQVYMYMYI